MKVVVLGAGVVGTTTAYYLMKQGHEVVVIDRQDHAGMETSYANGGQIACAHAEPWASPQTPFKALKWLGKKDAPLLFHMFRFDPDLWYWCYQFLRNCTAVRLKLNTEKTLRIALHSRDCLKALRTELALDYDQRQDGILHFYRSASEFDQACQVAEIMTDFGLHRKVMSARQCIDLEPSIKTIENQLHGGIYSSDDESGDAHKFTTQLAHICKVKGVDFQFSQTIRSLKIEQSRILGVETDKGLYKGDAYVLCLGSFSRELMKKSSKLSLPIYPAKGYSITLPILNSQAAPKVSLTDDEHKLVISRFRDRLRVAGTAELGGYDTELNSARLNFITQKTMELFPDIGDPKQVIEWSGLRPKTPDSVPIIGKSPVESLYFNTGHGTLGWTMSCGSAQVISDLITGKQPEISLEGFGFERF